MADCAQKFYHWKQQFMGLRSQERNNSLAIGQEHRKIRKKKLKSSPSNKQGKDMVVEVLIFIPLSSVSCKKQFRVNTFVRLYSQLMNKIRKFKNADSWKEHTDWPEPIRVD